MELELKVKGGLKRPKTEELNDLKKTLYHKVYEQEINDSTCRKVLFKLYSQVLDEIARRRRSKHVLVKFTCKWSGYSTSSARELGCEYERLDRKIAEKLPHFYAFDFSDGSKNYWTIEPVFAEPSKHYKRSGYSNQVDEIIRIFATKEGR